VFLILTYKYDDKEIAYSKYFMYAGALIILSRIVLLVLIIFQIQLIEAQTIGTLAAGFLANALIQHFPILITFIAFFSYIGTHNHEEMGNHLLYVAFIGTIYGVLLIIMDLGIFYYILGYAPLEIALAVGLAAFIVFVITFIFMFIVGLKHINKFFAIAGACFLLEYFFIAFILILLI